MLFDLNQLPPIIRQLRVIRSFHQLIESLLGQRRRTRLQRGPHFQSPSNMGEVTKLADQQQQETYELRVPTANRRPTSVGPHSEPVMNPRTVNSAQAARRARVRVGRKMTLDQREERADSN